jgi:20S proteasome alpha/beta subunit
VRIRRIGQKEIKMTIAIGAEFEGGTIVCADTKIVATDGATSEGSKVMLSVNDRKIAYAIANAAEDGNAASMMASELGSAACGSESWAEISQNLKRVMTEWYSGFGGAKPPVLQFILSYGGLFNSGLYFCEPPNTVLRVSHVIAIGRGSRPIEPMMHGLFWPIPMFGVKEALLKVAYLMYRAKKDEGSACGGNTTAVVVTKEGSFAFVEGEEMEAAERLAAKIENNVEDFRNGMLSLLPKDSQALKHEKCAERYLALVKEAENLAFPGLDWLNKTGWKAKQLEK